MQGINFGRVFLGGLLSGIVLNVGEFILNEPILGDDWAAAMAARNMPEPGGAEIFWYVFMTFVLGFALVYLYAAIRPRYGAGVRTAIYAGLIVWFLIWLWCFGSMGIGGMFPAKLIVITLVWGLVEVPLATVAGAWLYREGATEVAE